MRKLAWQIVLVCVLALGPLGTTAGQQVVVAPRAGSAVVVYSPAYQRYLLEYSTYPYGYVPYRVGMYVGPRHDPYWGEPYYGYYPYVYPRYIYPVPAVLAPLSRAEYHVVPRPTPEAPSNGELTPPRPLPSTNNVAEITILLPAADAQVFVEDYELRTMGTRRTLQSPPLTPGKRYEYTITASWKSNGQMVRQTRIVTLQAGQQITVDFTKPAPQDN
ncbi:MAG: TIGR03000 domain-containing protein [Gemmatales bacterium]|nr:TIGR03000 domain-containing protein [Gemmatales bacterium]MDW7993863.1 TIGR03000 domain-containing protein [Gemmatales bacterium]